MADEQVGGERDHPELVDRLRRFGRQPVDSALASQHLTAMLAVPGRRGRFSRKAVALAAVVGFLAGSTGLAAAGALPGPAQEVAHDVFGAVGIGVPRSTEDCPEGRTYKNHGQYVSEVEAAGGDVAAAAKSRCGKPDKAGKKANSVREPGDGGGSGTAPGARADSDGDPCTGPPPWAGQKLDQAEKAALQEAHRAACPDADEADEADEADDDQGEDEQEGDDESTSTTAASAAATADSTPTTEATTTTAEVPTTSTEATTSTTG